MSWRLFVGVAVFAVARLGRRYEDYSGPLVWRAAPRWARGLFGHVDGSIHPYRLVFELVGLCWVALSLLELASGTGPGTGADQAAALASFVALIAGALLCVLVGAFRLRSGGHASNGPDMAEARQSNLQAGATLSEASALEITYRVRLGDLYWMWATSRIGGVLWLGCWLAGLLLLSAPLWAARAPVVADVAAGALLLLAGPLVPLLAAYDLGREAWRRTVHLTFDGSGLAGWRAPGPGQLAWRQLRRPRLESRVLVLPFVVPPRKISVAVPCRALTPEQFDRLLALMRAHGFFLHRDHRSLVGRSVDAVSGRPHRLAAGMPMTSFPRLGRNGDNM